MNYTMLKEIFPKFVISFVLILLVLTTLTKIGGEFPKYPPIDKKPISWNEVVERLPHIILVSSFISLIFYFVLYWDWLNKNKNSKK
jgi:hypothetical protein